MRVIGSNNYNKKINKIQPCVSERPNSLWSTETLLKHNSKVCSFIIGNV